jgi:hypothetical protein
MKGRLRTLTREVATFPMLPSAAVQRRWRAQLEGRVSTVMYRRGGGCMAAELDQKFFPKPPPNTTHTQRRAPGIKVDRPTPRRDTCKAVRDKSTQHHGRLPQRRGEGGGDPWVCPHPRHTRENAVTSHWRHRRLGVHPEGDAPWAGAGTQASPPLRNAEAAMCQRARERSLFGEASAHYANDDTVTTLAGGTMLAVLLAQ